MKYALSLLLITSILSACQKEPLGSQVSQCPNPDRQYSRTSPINNVSATVRAAVINNKPLNSYWIQPAGSTQITPWAACNLPIQFQKDSLKITASGYMLTYPGLEFMNVAALPFEVTSIQVRE